MPSKATRVVSISVEKDNTDQILKALKERVPVALGAIGSEAVTYAQKDCPVDTGNLINSIAWATSKESGGQAQAGEGGPSQPMATPEENTVYIGSNVDYAVTQEYGDFYHKVGKKHFLRDAAANHVDHYKAILEAALKSQTL